MIQNISAGKKNSQLSYLQLLKTSGPFPMRVRLQHLNDKIALHGRSQFAFGLLLIVPSSAPASEMILGLLYRRQWRIMEGAFELQQKRAGARQKT